MIDEAAEIARWHELNEPNTDPHQPVPVPGQSIRYNRGYYEFRAIVPLYGLGFTSKLINTFIDTFGENAYSGNAKRAQALRAFLKFVAAEATRDSTGAAERVRSNLIEGWRPALKHFDSVSRAFADKVRNSEDFTIIKSPNKLYRATFLEAFSATIRNLGNAELWPRIPPIKRMHDRRSGHILTLGQLGPGRSNITYAGQDAFTRSVASSVARLAALRDVAEAVLLEEYQKFEEGKRLMAHPRAAKLSQIKEAVSCLTAYGRRKNERPIVLKIFPFDDPDRRLTNLLIYLDKMSDGVVPGVRDYPLNYLVAACGGQAVVSAYLEGSKRALLAAQVITLVDSGMNVQPCNDMPADPFYGEVRKASVTIATLTSTKTRPEDKPILVPVPVDGAEALLKIRGVRTSTVQAIEMWREMSARIRLRAEKQGNGEERFLWICPKGQGNMGVIQQLSDCGAKSQWNIFRRRLDQHPELAGLTFSRKNIRPTWLAARAARNFNDHTIIQAQASHKNPAPTFGNYLDKAEYHELLESRIRHFQQQLEAAILITSPSRIIHLAIEADELAARAEEAIHSGLDEILFDADRYRATAVERCEEIEETPTLIAKFLTFSPAPQDILALILFKTGLEISEHAFLLSNPARWNRTWMPAFALATAVAQRLEYSKYGPAYRQALERAQIGIGDGSMKSFVPW